VDDNQALAADGNMTWKFVDYVPDPDTDLYVHVCIAPTKQSLCTSVCRNATECTKIPHDCILYSCVKLAALTNNATVIHRDYGSVCLQ